MASFGTFGTNDAIKEGIMYKEGKNFIRRYFKSLKSLRQFLYRNSNCFILEYYYAGGNRHSWKKRHFILTEDKIEYFKTKGAQKKRGTINLTEGKGVRDKDQCKCKWPSGVDAEFCFGLAIESRTYYFYTTSERDVE